MAIYASNSTITTQTIPLIKIDLSDIAADDVLQWSPSAGAFVNTSLSLDGDAVVTGVSTLGSGTSIENGVTGNTLNLKSIQVGANMSITDDGSTVLIDIANGGSLLNTGTNIGAGVAEVYAGTVSNVLRFRRLALHAGNRNFQIQQDPNEILFNCQAEVNTASNIGTGAGIYKVKDGEDIQLRSIKGTGKITATVVGDEVHVDFPDYGFAPSDEKTVLIVEDGDIGNIPTGATGSFLKQTANGPAWTTDTYTVNRTFRVTFEQDGNLEGFSEVPADLQVSRIGNQLSITHAFGSWPKLVTYYGYDSVTNKYKYRQPTGNYQVLLDANNPTTTFEINVVASVMGADANGHGYINIIF